MSDSIGPEVRLEVQRLDNRVDQVVLEQTNHEEICADRYKQIRADIRQLRGWIGWGASLVVMVVLAVLGWSLKSQFDNSQEVNHALLLALSRLQPAAVAPR